MNRWNELDATDDLTSHASLDSHRTTSPKVTSPTTTAAPAGHSSDSPDVPAEPLSAAVASNTIGRPTSCSGRGYVRVSMVFSPLRTMLAHGSFISKPNRRSALVKTSASIVDDSALAQTHERFIRVGAGEG